MPTILLRYKKRVVLSCVFKLQSYRALHIFQNSLDKKKVNMGASTFWHLVQNKIQSLKATLMMIASQLILAALSISYKVASNDGMHVSILITYRYLVSSFLILPLALIIER